MLLYGSETWSFVTKDVQQLVTADSDTIRWICAVSLKDGIPVTDLAIPCQFDKKIHDQLAKFTITEEN